MASWSGRRWWAAEIPLRPSQVRLLSLTPVTGMRVTDLELERRWAQEVGPERWATFREVLAQLGRPAAGRP